MTETLESKIKKLEGKTGPQTDADDIEFQVYLVKESSKKPGTFLRRSYPNGKYQRIDAEALGIAPYKPVEHAQQAIKAAPVLINIPENKDDPAVSIYRVENDEDKIARIRSRIYEDFHK
jgi:hypothetical protein